MTGFVADAASFQGNVAWGQVAGVCAGGMEKVTQGAWYANPYWPVAKAAMLALAPQFTGAGYLFLEQGGGGAQADYFAARAGPMSGLGIVVDCEPMSGSARLADIYPRLRAAEPGTPLAMLAARHGVDYLAAVTSLPDVYDLADCVAGLRHAYPGHPIGGYIPHWYWDGQDTTMVDYLWASNYVPGSGPPQALYRQVTPGQWAGYGGLPVSLLQFTSSAAVPGVAGACDCSAYEGGDLAALFTGAPPAAPPTGTEEEPMWLPDNLRSAPVALPNGARRVRLAGLVTETVTLDWLPSAGGANPPTDSLTVGYAEGAAGVNVPAGISAVRVVRGDTPGPDPDTGAYPPVSLVVLT